jgi:uncharacterized repeat protein (TIGR03847 family)
MPGTEIELNPVDFITVGTIGPRGQRIFHLQGGQGKRLVSMVIEKEQARALSEAIREMLEDLEKREEDPISSTPVDISSTDMDLREPIEPIFRVAQMGLGYDESKDLVVLMAQELVVRNEADEGESEADGEEEIEPSIVRLWCSREQMKLLSEYTIEVVQAGRADPKQNGRMTYYWT